MTGLVEILKNFGLSLSTQDRTSTDLILKGVNGRDGFGPKLNSWLESSRDVFPETVRVEFTEHISDRGVDVYIEGQATQTGVGFQIKSDNDVRDKDFLPDLKRQVTDARGYANLQLYIFVMACSFENFGKIQFALNEELNQWCAGIPEIVLLVPGKAASLYQRCASPLSEEELGRLLKDRSWNRFFVESGAIDRENDFLNHWSGLPPQDRFATPRNIERIENSLADYPLTVLVGPPTIGKTYTAVQLLYRHFKQGRTVEWIAPPGQEPANFIVTFDRTTPNFSQRIHTLTRRLGMVPPQPPRNRWEFIAARLQADSLIFIEDPFGRTEEEFRSSLHTYDFFDLDGCIEGILEEGSAQDCRLIMTSRHGLLDTWLEERRRKLGQEFITIPEGMSIIHLGPDNYRGSWFRNSGPLFDLASKLLRSSGRINEKEIEELSITVAKELDTPQAVEFVIASLPQHVDKEAINKAIKDFPRDALQQIEVLCQSCNDSERLFLWVMIESSTGHALADFATMYTQLFQAMRLAGDAALEDVAARAKYDLLYYPREYNETNTVYGEDGKPLRWGVYLSAAHPSITEAARQEITNSENGFLNRFAHSLLNLRGDPLSQSYLDRVAYFLAEELDSLDNTAIEQLSLVLPQVLKPTFGTEENVFNILLRRLSGLSDVLHQALIKAVQNGDPLLATKACDYFRYSSAHSSYTWPFYSVLCENFVKVRPGFAISPWEYLVEHLGEVPQEISDRLEAIAIMLPSHFTYAFGNLAATYWDKFPQSWKSAILSDHAENTVWVERPAALKSIYFGLFREKDECPPELLGLLTKYLNHPEVDFRSTAGAFYLVHWERLPETMRDELRQRFQIETDVTVLTKILMEGSGSDADSGKLELFEIVLRRGNAAVAAWLIGILRDKIRENKALIEPLIEQCHVKAGELSLAFESPETDEMMRGNANDILGQPPMKQLAWLWRQVTHINPMLTIIGSVTIPDSGEAQPSSETAHRRQEYEDRLNAAPTVKMVVERLSGEYSACAHYILKNQSHNLLPVLRDFLHQVEANESTPEAIRVAMQEGKRDDEREMRRTKSHVVPPFPMRYFGPLLGRQG